jgi:hypothetical protein
MLRPQWTYNGDGKYPSQTQRSETTTAVINNSHTSFWRPFNVFVDNQTGWYDDTQAEPQNGDFYFTYDHDRRYDIVEEDEQYYSDGYDPNDVEGWRY